MTEKYYSFGMWRRVVWQKPTDVLEEWIASIFIVEEFSDCGENGTDIERNMSRESVGGKEKCERMKTIFIPV
jgi:hypothetical protein